MEYIRCIICKSEESQLYQTIEIKDGESFNLVKCVCGFIYLNPRPNKALISKYYCFDDYKPHDLNFSLLSTILLKISYFWKYQIIKKKFKNKGIHIDIGSGNGLFSDFLNKKGWKSLKYDPYINDNKNIFTNISEMDDKSIDLITMWHSIEHMHNIDELFDIMISKIKNNGFFMIACPNINAKEKDYFGLDWVAYDVPRHLYHFNPNSLNRYLNKYNIKIVERYPMKQDTIFNIFYSLSNNIIIKIPFLIIYSIYCLLLCLIQKNKYSSYVYICQLD